MAEKLSIEIKLAGGEEIERQLADIGEAGQKAFGDIAEAARKAGGFKNLKPDEVTAKLKEMGIVGKDALDKISGAVSTATKFQRLAGIVEGVEGAFSKLAQGAMSFGRALGPIGIAAAFVGTKVVNAMNEAEAAIRKVDAAAIKAGMSIERFDQLRQAFEKMGLSAQGVEQALLGVASAAEKARIEAVTTAFKQLQEAATRGFGGIGTAQLKLLVETARGVGPAAESARKALTDLGVSFQLPATTLADFIAKTGDAARGTAAFVESLRQMPDGATRSALAIDAFKDAGVGLVQALRNGTITQDQFKERLGTISQEAANAANATEQSTNRMESAWERFKQSWDPAQFGEAWAEVLNKIGGGWASFTSAGKVAIDAVVGAFDFLINKIKEAVGWLGRFFTSSGASASTGSTTEGFAHGGPVGGRGTGTSDSNLAWVSRGEHIMPARAVGQPGVLAFLEALRRSGGNLGRVLDGMGRYAAGGLVRMPAFAAGGSVGSMSHVTIQFPGMPDIAGLRASSSVVDELRKAAAMAQVRSGGRKPSRYT